MQNNAKTGAKAVKNRQNCTQKQAIIKNMTYLEFPLNIGYISQFSI